MVEINDIAGLGTVYLLTLLYYITAGECPIYDHFAMGALVSFELSEKYVFIPGSIIRLKSLPTKEIDSDGNFKNSKKIKSVLTEENSVYREYCGLLQKYFSEDWRDNIYDIDKALWVYGHFFKVRQE